jgi:excinuclease UvrABC ATPase subunit
MRDLDHIEVRGARENNLRDVSVDIPKRAITGFTGVSGSGKSSLVFGTIAPSRSGSSTRPTRRSSSRSCRTSRGRTSTRCAT